MLAETVLADLRARAARVCWCKCTACTTKEVPLRKMCVCVCCLFVCVCVFFLVAQPVHWHQHARAARLRKSASMVWYTIVYCNISYAIVLCHGIVSYKTVYYMRIMVSAKTGAILPKDRGSTWNAIKADPYTIITIIVITILLLLLLFLRLHYL